MHLRTSRPRLLLAAVVATTAFALAACGRDDAGDTAAGRSGPDDTATITAEAPVARTLRIGAIPDQDPEKLARLNGLLADYLATELDADVEYVPVTDYSAAVNLFSTGDLDLVWFGGLTGVQARLETPGSEVLAQRDIDERFQSVFIANAGAGIEPVTEVADLDVFAGRRFTFGSESSTSGRLMPQYFLDQAGLGPDDFSGEPGFSGSHDATIDLVASGSFESGALNLQVWERRVAEGTVDASQVVEIFRTPEYNDYHWILQPDAIERYGDGFTDEVTAALLGLDPADPSQAEILELYGAQSFVASDASNYVQIEEIGRTLGLITS